MNISSIIAQCLAILALVELALAQGDLFKINKLNLIWHKAQHSLGPTKLKDLKNDLISHEAEELKLKKLKAHNQDKDGIIEATVRKKLLSIMGKYSLERYIDDITTLQANKNAQTTNTPTQPVEPPTFRDSKLDKLWKKAEKAGFDHEQLMVLHEEFQHQQDKLDDHYDTLNMIEEEIERATKLDDRKVNSIEETPDEANKKRHGKGKQSKEKESEKKARLEENIYQGLKDKYGEIKRSISDLSKKVASGILDENLPFKENIVNNLWEAALQSNFSGSELDSLKEELSHYEIRIEKLKHFQSQLERHDLGAKGSKSYGENDKEIKHIKKKVKELTQKVDKTHKTIEKKILREEL